MKYALLKLHEKIMDKWKEKRYENYIRGCNENQGQLTLLQIRLQFQQKAFHLFQ